MFFVGVAITLFGVYLLSQRDMVSLKPTGRLRASVFSVMFVKRVQKRVGHSYSWIQDPTVVLQSKNFGKTGNRSSVRNYWLQFISFFV